MQKIEQIQQEVREIDQTILTYYDYSFRIDNEKCMILIQKLISQLETLFNYIDAEQTALVQEILLRALKAMENKDYVLLRDILYYELRQLLAQLS